MEQKEVYQDGLPDFRHAAVKKLYFQGFELELDLLDDVLQLPREPLIEDLNTILQDHIDRYELPRIIRLKM